jgi:predicted MPP superfamily phosphohydrolase
LKAWPVLGITLIQAILFFGHWFIYRTWVALWFELSPAEGLALRVGLSLLSVSFIVATLLGFQFSATPVRFVYKIAAVWLGLLNFLFLAACLCRLADLAFRLAGLPGRHPQVAGILYSLALLTGVYGVLNARWIRVRHVAVRLENLPEEWLGRRAVLFSDLHLGNINGAAFCRRIAAMAGRLDPDIVFIPGDVFDGTPVDAERMTALLGGLKPRLGMYFAAGNHDEFGDTAAYLAALKRAGVRVLANERVVVEGVVIAGIPYHDSTYPMRVRATLEGLGLEAGQPCILLNHAPARLPIVEQAGVSLQLSGHTHGGQLFPFTWFTRRAFGKFTYGLQRFGNLQVYTTYGAGTWGPPMRVGTSPEMVVITFE